MGALRTRSSVFLRVVLVRISLTHGIPSSFRCRSGGPFARVVRTWIDKDQSLPARLAKRGQTTGQVRGLALDFDFSQIPESCVLNPSSVPSVNPLTNSQ
jgi:hypothetical protein